MTVRQGFDETVLVRSSTTYLFVEEQGRKLRDVRLGDAPIVLGSAADSDLLISSPCVSPRHARIESIGASYQIVDLGSERGLLHRGRRIKSHVFADGDVIRIGDPSTGTFVSLTFQDVGKRAQRQPDRAIERCPLTKLVTSLGRSGCDLNLPSLQVSRHHADVSARNGRHHFVDRGSVNGSFINGRRVTDRWLRRGDVIQIGPFRLVYDGRALTQYSHQGALRIDARGLTHFAGGKAILKDVSLVIEPCEFIAIVGPSGAGKSTLMGALSGFERAHRGRVYVNGEDFYENFDAYRGVLGYVPQDDILHRGLRVGEALIYTALLRLPDDTRSTEIAARIARVLADVEMMEHRQQRIDELSGGQRKRVSIASELIADPSLFFLDEPTSGLDPGLEKKMMYTLRYLADSGRTVVLVTHATANIMQCDQVAFMADGRMVYYGPPAGALDMFRVRDFADIYTKLHVDIVDHERLANGELAREYAVWREHNPNARHLPSLAHLWEIRYRRDLAYQRCVYERQTSQIQRPETVVATIPVELQAIAPGTYHEAVINPSVAVPSARVEPTPASLPRQIEILARRYLRLIVSDRKNLMILLLQAPVIGVVLLLAARENALQNTTSSNGRLVMFLLAIVAVWFGVLNSVREITKEQLVFRRERLVNLRIDAYLLSKVGVLAALCFVQSLALVTILAFKVDFSAAVVALTDEGFMEVVRAPPFGLWGATFVTVFLTSLTGVGLGLLISTAVSNSDKAMSVVPLALIPQLVFALALMPLPPLLAPLSYLTGARWGMEALGSIAWLIEPRDLSDCEIPGSLLTCETYATVDYDPATGHVLSTWMVLLAYTIYCLVLTAWALRRRASARR